MPALRGSNHRAKPMGLEDDVVPVGFSLFELPVDRSAEACRPTVSPVAGRGRNRSRDPYRSRVHHAGTRAVRRRRRHRVRHRVDRCCLTVGRRHTQKQHWRQRVYTQSPRQTDNRTTGQPASGEVNTNIVLTAATHDGGYGGVDAVNLVDTSPARYRSALSEDCVRADVPNRVPGYNVHFTVGLAHHSADPMYQPRTLLATLRGQYASRVRPRSRRYRICLAVAVGPGWRMEVDPGEVSGWRSKRQLTSSLST